MDYIYERTGRGQPPIRSPHEQVKLLKTLVFVVLSLAGDLAWAEIYYDTGTVATVGGYFLDGGRRGGEVSLHQLWIREPNNEMGLMYLAGGNYGWERNAVRYFEASASASVWVVMGTSLGVGPRWEDDRHGWQATWSLWYFAPIFFARAVQVEEKREMQYGAMLKLPIPLSGNLWDEILGDEEKETAVPP